MSQWGREMIVDCGAFSTLTVVPLLDTPTFQPACNDSQIVDILIIGRSGISIAEANSILESISQDYLKKPYSEWKDETGCL